VDDERLTDAGELLRGLQQRRDEPGQDRPLSIIGLFVGATSPPHLGVHPCTRRTGRSHPSRCGRRDQVRSPNSWYLTPLIQAAIDRAQR